VPRGASGIAGSAAAGAVAGTDTGAVVAAAAVDEVAEVAERCATGARVPTGGAIVSGRGDGVTICDSATAATRRTGSSSRVASPASSDAVPDGAPATASSPAPVHTGSGAAGAARRWIGRVGIEADEVRLGTGIARATTRPAGAVGADSWPSGWTIGGSGRCPGTSRRNGAGGATSGAARTVRWIGGSEAHARVGRPARGAAGSDVAAGSAAVPGSVADGPDGVPRPKGQGRRTG